MQCWRDLFLFFSLTSLWLFTARGLLEVISVETCWQGTAQNSSFLSTFPSHLTNIARTSQRSTMSAFTILDLKLEFAICDIIQMLLVMSGIETNPGPTNPTGSGSASGSDTTCCNAGQHFNRVKRVIADVQNNFRSKVGPDTLTKPVIEIHEAGKWKYCFSTSQV